jgi:hypothetical protein
MGHPKSKFNGVSGPVCGVVDAGIGGALRGHWFLIAVALIATAVRPKQFQI